MKFRRFLSSLFFGLGCALSFIGLLTVILPTFKNPQLQLVLSSFSMTSSNAIVTLVNRFMTFALQQNWQLLYTGLLIAGAGAWLLLRFTPKAPRKEEFQGASFSVQPVQENVAPAAEQPNPFAAVSYTSPPATPSSSKASVMLHSEPILERNQIVEEEVPEPDASPYFSPRFPVESRAIETEAGPLSQSGSRILVRSAYDPLVPEILAQPEGVSSVPDSNPEPAGTPASTSDLSVPEPITPPSPRIRSTMGRHSPGSTNLPLSRS